MHAEAKARPDPESVRGSVADQSNEGTDERMTVYMMKCNLLLCNAVFAIKKETRNDSCLSVSRLAVFRFVVTLCDLIQQSLQDFTIFAMAETNGQNSERYSEELSIFSK